MGAIIDVADRRGRVTPVALIPGETLMRSMRDAGLPVAAICDGAKSCGTCHVYVTQAPRLAAPDEDEFDLLADLEGYDPATSRLSCQIPVDDLTPAVVVSLAPDGI